MSRDTHHVFFLCPKRKAYIELAITETEVVLNTRGCVNFMWSQEGKKNDKWLDMVYVSHSWTSAVPGTGAVQRGDFVQIAGIFKRYPVVIFSFYQYKFSHQLYIFVWLLSLFIVVFLCSVHLGHVINKKKICVSKFYGWTILFIPHSCINKLNNDCLMLCDISQYFVHCNWYGTLNRIVYIP